MRVYQTIVLVVAALGLAGATAVRADDVGTAFTYQGELIDNGTPVDDDCVFSFSLWDMAAGGSQIGSTLTPTVTVTDGRFTEVLDFGDDRFPGSPRFLEMSVCCPAACTPSTTLSPNDGEVIVTVGGKSVKMLMTIESLPVWPSVSVATAPSGRGFVPAADGAVKLVA